MTDHSQSALASKAPAKGRVAFTLIAILLSSILLIAISLLLQGSFSEVLSNPISWITSLDSATAFDAVTTTAELLAAVLAIAITVVAIIVELAANRYSHRITSLFVREPINIAVMSYFVVITIASLWIALTLDASVEPTVMANAGLLICMLLVTVSLVILLPYFAYVMTFLSPINILEKIYRAALDSVILSDSKSTEVSKIEFLSAVDELQDIARRSMEQSDRAVEMESINALFKLMLSYRDRITEIEEAHIEWFEVSLSVRQDPDFVSIDKASLARINSNKLWAEVKILRQYLDLMADGNLSTRDTSYLIAINTKKIAVESIGKERSLELIRLCTRCFNSYLRTTINKKDARTSYYIMNQYRMLAEELLASNIPEAAEEIALHLKFYGLLAYNQNLPFLLEVAAEDVVQLAQISIDSHPEVLDKLINILLTLDQELKEESHEECLLGVRRAQFKLATVLLHRNDSPRASIICKDLKTEKPNRILGIIDVLRQEDRQEYWEFTDRGVNYSYLEPELRAHLDTVWEMSQENLPNN